MTLNLLFVLACKEAEDGKDKPSEQAEDSAEEEQEAEKETEEGVDAFGTTRFVDSSYIQLAEIAHISRFRSAAGHDYSDDFEECRSMKHYFWPVGGEPGGTQENWAEIEIFSPVDGEITHIREEWAGSQIDIRSAEQPNYHFLLFHLSPSVPLEVGMELVEGQSLGQHIGSQTMSDIAVGIETENGWKLLSYFDVMTDSHFENYKNRGLESREELIISQEEREAAALSCEDGSFVGQNTLDDWLSLN